MNYKAVAGGFRNGTEHSKNVKGGDVLGTQLTGLEEFVEYNITVRAYTDAGNGPLNAGVIMKTLEAGMY